MGVEEVEHIVNAHDGAYDGGNSVGHDIDFGKRMLSFPKCTCGALESVTETKFHVYPKGKRFNIL